MIPKKAAILFGLLAVAAAFWYFSERRWKVIDYPRGGENIIAFGDSLVVGYGASSDNDFVSLLSRRIGRAIINAGRNGDTTAIGLSRLEKDVLSRNPRVVILLLGGNDAIRGAPVRETFSHLATMIDRIHQSDAAVILVGIRGGFFRDSYRREFEKLVEEKQVNYVPDILDGIFGEPRLMADAIHPNDEGNKTMADRIEPVLRKLLE